MEPVKIKKLAANFLMGFGILVAVLFILKGTLTKILVVNAVQKTTGLSISIKDLHLSLSKGVIKVDGLQLKNPGGFPKKEKVLATIPELYIDLDLMAVLQGKIHLEEVVLNLSELIILRNNEGKLNLSSLRPIQEEPKGQEKTPSAPQKQTSFQLDYLRLSIGKAYYRDYRLGDSPPSREYPIGITDEEFRNITDAGELVRQIIAQALSRTVFAELGDLEGIQRRLEKNLEKAQASMRQKTQQVLQEATEALNALQFLKPKPSKPEENQQ